jgi:hypothetical protein
MPLFENQVTKISVFPLHYIPNWYILYSTARETDPAESSAACASGHWGRRKIMNAQTIYANDGNCEVAYEGIAASEAAQKYVDDGDWGEITSTVWISVSTYRKDADGEIYDEKGHTIAIDPEEPDCVDGEEHDWRTPHSVLGGLKENPGVHGHGGGVICKEVCAHCGAYKITDSWAQNPETGEQGLDSIEYRDADDDSRPWVEKRLLTDVVEPALDECEAVVEYRNKGTEIVAVLTDSMDLDEAVELVRKTINNDRIDASWRTANEDDRTISITVEL